MKKLFLITLFSLVMSAQQSKRAIGPATLEALCNPCSAEEPVQFTGTGYPTLSGAKDHYMFCYVDLPNACGLIPKSLYPAVNGVLAFPWSMPVGTWNVCVVLWQNSKPDQTMGCTTVTVE